MGRPPDKHIDEKELHALVPSCCNEGQGMDPDPVSVRAAERHVASCPECKGKLAEYRQLMDRVSAGDYVDRAPQPDCPTEIDWHEIAVGLWPELRAQRLITHAARCAYCGPLLRAAASADEPSTEEEAFLAQLKHPARPALQAKIGRASCRERVFLLV